VFSVGGAATGREISRVLAEAVLRHPRIEVSEGERALELRTDEGRCVGVVTDRRAIAARAVLLATGGYAALWERTTNPAGSVGEGIALAYRAGAAVADLEFVQFHPTALAGSSLLLSEALRGDGALLLDSEGERFVEELAPRDVVARAIDARGTALLDLRPIDRTRFPALMQRLAEAGFDPSQSRISAELPRCQGCSPLASARARASTARTGSRRTRCWSAWSSAAAPLSRHSRLWTSHVPGPGPERCPFSPMRPLLPRYARHSGAMRGWFASARDSSASPPRRTC